MREYAPCHLGDRPSVTSNEPPLNSNGKPLTQREQLGEESRHKILEAAATLFARQGYDGTSISQLSKACGLPTSSIYWHFGSKEGVLWAVADRVSTAYLQRDFSLEDFDGDPVERLRAMLEEVARTLHEGEDALRLLLRLTLTSGRRAKGAHEAAEHVERVSLDRWREPLREVFAPDGDPSGLALADELALTLRAFGHGAFVESQTMSGETDFERFRSLVLTFWDLIRARAEEHRRAREQGEAAAPTRRRRPAKQSG